MDWAALRTDAAVTGALESPEKLHDLIAAAVIVCSADGSVAGPESGTIIAFYKKLGGLSEDAVKEHIRQVVGTMVGIGRRAAMERLKGRLDGPAARLALAVAMAAARVDRISDPEAKIFEDFAKVLAVPPADCLALSLEAERWVKPSQAK